MEHLKNILATLFPVLYFHKSLIFAISDFNAKMVFTIHPMFACSLVSYYKDDLRVEK